MRDVTLAAQTALSSSNVPFLVLVELDFVGGAVRCTNAGYTFRWNGYDWLGIGNLGGIDAVQEGLNLQMYGCKLTLSGIKPELIQTALDAQYQGRHCTIYLAPLTADYQILSSPAVVFKGRMDTMDIELGETATITVTAESRLIDWERPRVRRYNHEDQQAAFPGDMGMQFVQQMVSRDLVWGRQ